MVVFVAVVVVVMAVGVAVWGIYIYIYTERERERAKCFATGDVDLAWSRDSGYSVEVVIQAPPTSNLLNLEDESACVKQL